MSFQVQYLVVAVLTWVSWAYLVRYFGPLRYIIRVVVFFTFTINTLRSILLIEYCEALGFFLSTTFTDKKFKKKKNLRKLGLEAGKLVIVIFLIYPPSVYKANGNILMGLVTLLMSLGCVFARNKLLVAMKSVGLARGTSSFMPFVVSTTSVSILPIILLQILFNGYSWLQHLATMSLAGFLFAADYNLKTYLLIRRTENMSLVATTIQFAFGLIFEISAQVFGFFYLLRICLAIAFFVHLHRSLDKKNEELLPTKNRSKGILGSSIVINTKLIVNEILDSKESKKIFYFLIINFAFMFVELFFGIITNSLGLVGDAFHMLFDCTALAIGLYASVISRWEANKSFTYGFGRVEVLSGFVNGIFLCFISLSILSKSIKRIIMPQDVQTDNLLLVSVLGLLVNLVGIFAFHDIPFLNDCFKKKETQAQDHSNHGHHHHGHDCGHEHSDNMYGIFLHILADALGSVSVIISSILIHLYGWRIADPICSLFLSILIFLSVIPLLKSSVGVLMQGTPPNLQKKLQKYFAKVKAIPGIDGISKPHFWSNTKGQIVGSIHLHIKSKVHEQRILQSTKTIFGKANIKDFTVQIIKSVEPSLENSYVTSPVIR